MAKTLGGPRDHGAEIAALQLALKQANRLEGDLEQIIAQMAFEYYALKAALERIPQHSKLMFKDEPTPEHAYGLELVIDLYGCDVIKFTRKSLGMYFKELCELIDMKREDLHFWDDLDLPVEQRQTDPRTEGISAVQFILTSTVVLHALTQLRQVYINVFSCKDFDAEKATTFTARFFDAQSWSNTSYSRGLVK